MTASPGPDASIAQLATRRLTFPLSRPWGPDVRTITIIAVDVADSDGAVGHGFSWTPTIGAAAVQSMLDTDIRDRVVGHPIDPVALWPHLWRHLHEAGGGGITTIAMAGLDTALWDLAGRRAGRAVVDLIGRRQQDAEVYGSGVNLHYSLDELVAQAERWVAAGYRAAKVKVGKPDLGEDVDRIAAVRDVLGPNRRLMIDANQRWDLPTAIRSIGELARFDLDWVEEPLRADDLLAHRELRSAVDVPIAVGENLHTRYRFAEFLDAGVVDVIQPNIVRVGGITPFLHIAELVEGTAVRLAPHLLFELSGQLALTLPTRSMVEEVEDAGFAELGALVGSAPVRADRDTLVADLAPGLGLEFVAEDPSSAHVGEDPE